MPFIIYIELKNTFAHTHIYASRIWRQQDDTWATKNKHWIACQLTIITSLVFSHQQFEEVNTRHTFFIRFNICHSKWKGIAHWAQFFSNTFSLSLSLSLSRSKLVLYTFYFSFYYLPVRNPFYSILLELAGSQSANPFNVQIVTGQVYKVIEYYSTHYHWIRFIQNY